MRILRLYCSKIFLKFDTVINWTANKMIDMKIKILLLILSVLMLKNLTAQITILENGDQVAWDGQYYDFRDAEGVKMIKLWVPPDIHPVKGVSPGYFFVDLVFEFLPFCLE